LQAYYPELVSSLIAELITDVIMFPMETAVIRINIQVRSRFAVKNNQ